MPGPSIITPSHILLCRTDRIGDVVISTSCIHPIREKYPHAALHFLVQPKLAALLNGHAALDSVEVLPDESLNTFARIDCMKSIIAGLAIDTVILLHPDPIVEQAAFEMDVQNRVGYRKYKRTWLTQALPDRRGKGDKHEAQYCFDLLQCIGIEAPRQSLAASLHVAQPASEAALSKLGGRTPRQGFAAIHLGAHGNKLRVPTEHLAEIARWLIHSQDMEVILIGDEDRTHSVDSFLRHIGESGARIKNLHGQLDLAETSLILANARVFASRDTGPAHIAAAVGCPTVTVFVDPAPYASSRRWRPLGEKVVVVEKALERHWFETDRRYANRYRNNITVSDIIDGIGLALNL